MLLRLRPGGASNRITYCVLNLCHHRSHESPEALVPGKVYAIKLQLDDIAWRVPEGHRLRVAISTAYWPMVWPSPGAATLTLTSGALLLPVCEENMAGENQV